MARPTLEQKIKAAELQLKLIEVQRALEKRQQEDTASTIQKIGALRYLLTDSFIGTKDGSNNYVPVMTDKEAQVIKTKLFELINKL